MNKKTVGIISVVASCIVCSIAKRFFDKDREKELEEENKIVHDSVEKIFSESRDKRMEKLDLELNKELEESRKKHEEEMKKHAETMKKLEEQRQEHERKWNELDARCKERLDKSKDDFDEFIKAGHECVRDIHEVSKEIFSDYSTEIKEENRPNKYETRIVFKGKLAEMMKET